MDFKDRMIEAVERGFTTDENAYDYVRESMADAADQKRDRTSFECGYPECDCQHICRATGREVGRRFAVGDRVVWRDDPADTWTGYITSVPAGADFVFVKLDVGGTFRVPIGELKRETP